MGRAYHEVAAELRRRIERGIYGPKAPLPSERALVQEFEIHRATLRRALNLLAEEGVVSRKPGERPYPQAGRGVRNGSIGLCAAEPSDPFARGLIANGMSEALTEQGSPLRLLWSNVRSFQLDHKEDEEDFLSQEISALVIWPPALIALDRLRNARERMPVTLVDIRVPGFESDFVGFNDLEAGYTAAKHLYEVGHRRIAFLGDIIPETVQYRWAGVMRFCKEAGIEPYWRFGAFGGSDPAIPDSLLSVLIEMPREQWPSAAVCANDEMAAHLISYFAKRGLSVPEDLSLIGFGGAQPSLLNAIGLTTMVQPYEIVGREAVRMIMERQKDPHQAPREIRLSMNLKVRSSCGTGSVPCTP